MHFDILVPSEVTDEQIVFKYGIHYLRTKSIKSDVLTAKECRLCHIQTATEEMIASIVVEGYAIIEMENCN